MWFQVDLPQPVMLTEIQFDSANTGRAGGPGRGGAPGAAAGGAGVPPGAGAATAGGANAAASPAGATGPVGAQPSVGAAAAAALAGPPPAPVPAVPAGPQIPAAGFPRGYRVQVSLDGVKWSTPPVAEGKGSGARTVISFKPVQAEVRAHHAGRCGRGRAGLVDSQSAAVRGRESCRSNSAARMPDTA